MEKLFETVFIWFAVGISFYVFSYVLYKISTDGEKMSNKRLPAILIYVILVLLTAGSIYFLTKERGVIASIALFYLIAVISWITNKRGIGQAGI